MAAHFVLINEQSMVSNAFVFEDYSGMQVVVVFGGAGVLHSNIRVVYTVYCVLLYVALIVYCAKRRGANALVSFEEPNAIDRNGHASPAEHSGENQILRR